MFSLYVTGFISGVQVFSHSSKTCMRDKFGDPKLNCTVYCVFLCIYVSVKHDIKMLNEKRLFSLLLQSSTIGRDRTQPSLPAFRTLFTCFYLCRVRRAQVCRQCLLSACRLSRFLLQCRITERNCYIYGNCVMIWSNLVFLKDHSSRYTTSSIQKISV